MGQCQTVQYNKRESVPAALFRMSSARCVNLAGLSRRPECITVGLFSSAQENNTLTIISKTPRIQSIVYCLLRTYKATSTHTYTL